MERHKETERKSGRFTVRMSEYKQEEWQKGRKERKEGGSEGETENKGRQEQWIILRNVQTQENINLLVKHNKNRRHNYRITDKSTAGGR